MKDIQQRLLIEDLDYCNTVCDETEEIVGGGKLWNAIKGEVKDTWNAVKETGKGLLEGKLPTGKTAEDLLVPIEWRVLERLFGPK